MSDTFGITPDGFLSVGGTIYRNSKTFSKDYNDPLGELAIRRGRVLLDNGWAVSVIWGTYAKCENFLTAGAELNEAPTTCEVALFDTSPKCGGFVIDKSQILGNATTQQVNELIVLGSLLAES